MRKTASRKPEKFSYAAFDRGLNAAIQRRTGETPRDRQQRFGRGGKGARRLAAVTPAKGS
jgi:hypothetical protein